MATDDWVRRVVDALRPLADPVRAEPMRAYMKDIAPFLGVPAPERRAAVKPLGLPADVDLVEACDALLALPEREFHYIAVETLAQRAKYQAPSFLDVLERVVRRTAWWDCVDTLTHGVGDVVRAHPHLLPRLDEWLDDPDFWVARAAILHQLGQKAATDEARLFRYCLARAHEKEFFLRKATGWALRDYAWTNPSAVAAFVDAHRDELSALTIREATKNLGSPRAGSRR